jgi:hypothetical protein
MSLEHARTVALVLNLNTGHVSPQFHVKFDPRFESVRGSLGNLALPSEWQEECGFKKSVVQRKSREGSVNRKLIREEPKALEGEQKGSEGGETRSDIIGPPEMLDEDDPTKLELRRSARRSRPPVRLGIDEVWMAMESECEKAMDYYVAYEVMKEWFDGDQIAHPMLAFAASADPDTMYYHEAMKEPDCEQFLKAGQ